MSQNTLFAHLISEEIYDTAKTIAGILGPSSGDSLSYEAIQLSADGQLPVTHRLAIGSCTAEWAASAQYLQSHPEVLAAQTGLPLADCQAFCSGSILYVDTVGEEVISLESVLVTNNLIRIEGAGDA